MGAGDVYCYPSLNPGVMYVGQSFVSFVESSVTHLLLEFGKEFPTSGCVCLQDKVLLMLFLCVACARMLCFLNGYV